MGFPIGFSKVARTAGTGFTVTRLGTVMGRSGFGPRLLMAVVGLAVLAGYAGAAYLGYLAVQALWTIRPDPAVLIAVLVGVTAVSGYLSYRSGTARLLSAFPTSRLPRDRAPALHRRLDRLVERMDLDRPEVYVAQMGLPNALAVGGPGRGALVLDRALFRLLNADELDGIMAHELAHLESHDSLVRTLAYSAGRTVVALVALAVLPAVLLLTGIARGWMWIRGRPFSRGRLDAVRRGVGRTVVVVFVALALLVRAHSRRREFAADDRAVAVTGDPIALARALKRIDRASEPGWGLFAPLYRDENGDKDDPVARWLSTHPPMDERIERLTENTRSHSRHVPIE